MDKLTDKHIAFKIKASKFTIEKFGKAGDDYWNFEKDGEPVFGLFLQSETTKYITFKTWIGDTKHVLKFDTNELIPTRNLTI